MPLLEFFETVFDWGKLVTYGSDVVVYFFMALAGTLVFAFRFGLLLLFGGDGGDLDGDSGDIGDDSFSLLSIMSISSFLMGTGWMGLALRIDWEVGGLVSALSASGFGITLMFGTAGLAYGMRRLTKTNAYDMNTVIGATGRVYTQIPEKGDGHGQVQATVSGSRRTLRARSTGPAIEAFKDVEIVEVNDDETIVVRPI